jgi:tetratricopeptide (TPR) repeat protein
MKRIACGFFLMLAFVAQAAEAQGRGMDGNRRQSWLPVDVTFWQWMLMNGSGTPPPLSSASGSTVSVTSLEIPETARKEMQEFAKNFEAGKLEESVKHAEKALRIYPQWAAARLDLGQCYARMHQYQKAIEEYQMATTLDAHMAQPWVGLAGVYLLEGQYGEGENAARRALEIDPVNVNARYFLGRILAIEGHDLSDAVELLRKSREQYPAAHLTLANIYLKQNQTEEAIGELRGYLADPNATQKEKVTCMVEKLTKPAGTVSCIMQ